MSFVADGASPCPEVAYSIGRAAGTAVVRNRLRRRCRAAVRESAPRLAPGKYLIRLDPSAAALDYRTLAEATVGALAAAGDAR